MQGLRSRIKGILGFSTLSTQTSTDEVRAMPASDLDQSPPSGIGSEEDRIGFLELASGMDPIIDIVAIHGLDGHREKTWTADNGTLWLRDLLSTDIPNARILAYGYNANTRSQDCVEEQTIYQHADRFLDSLLIQRSDSQRRPIIFIAHSLGGIVLKQALVLCHVETLGSTWQLRNILVSTHAILFFGTPHFGIKGVELLNTMNRLLSVYLKTTKAVLRNLKSNSPELRNIQNLFNSASEGIETVHFYEVSPTSIVGGKRQMIVPYHSATVPGDRHAINVGLDADHCEMVKFSHARHANYTTVLAHIKQRVKGASSTVTGKWSKEDAYRDLANRGDPSPQSIILPKPRPGVSRNYVDRPEIQSLITNYLLPTAPSRHQPRCVLHGIGGAGKTQLATNWIQENESSFSRVIFVDASSRTQLEKDLELSIHCLGSEYGKATWKDAIAYLDGKEKGWLLFLDNADSPDLDLRPYLPTSIHGTILITTRNSEYAGYAPDSAIPVGNFAEDEAVKLLHKVSNLTPQSDDKSLEIIRELGMLALAVTQAGVYIRKTRRIDTYLDIFRRGRDRLLQEKPDCSIEYTSSTYTAFDLSFNSLPAKTREFLKLCAFLHHSLIPLSLFEESARNSFITYTVRSGCPPPKSDEAFASDLKEILGSTWDEIEFMKMIGSASRTSFINISSDGLAYGVHPLLRMYIKDRLDKEGNERYTRMARQLVLGAIRPVKGSNAYLWPLLPHANNLPRSVQVENVAHALAFHQLFESTGDSNSCRELLETTLCQLQQTKGKRHNDALWDMWELGTALHRCGRLEGVEKRRIEVLALYQDIFGVRHTETISAMNNLAIKLADRGQWVEAEKIRREVLALGLEILGERHPRIISAMEGLAMTLDNRGQWVEAEKMRRDVLALRLEILGERHPHTILAMMSLADTLRGCDQLVEAEQIEREVFAQMLGLLGEHHPDTILAMSNLADTLYHSCQMDEAESMQQKVLALSLKLFGRQYPGTAAAMHNLAATLHDRGHPDEAERLQRETLSLRLETIGQQHPRALDTSYNLSLMLFRRDEDEEAKRLLEETMELRIVAFGEDHAHTRRPQELLADIMSKRLPGSPQGNRTHKFLLRE